MPLSLAAGTLALLALGWLVMEMRSLQSQLEEVHSQQAAASRDRQSLDTQAQDLDERIGKVERDEASRAPTPPLPVPSMVLSSVRSDALTLYLPDAAHFVELSVDLQGDDAYPSFRATLITSTGAHLWTGTDLRLRETDFGSHVVVRLTASLLDDGSYELTVEGGDKGSVVKLGSYSFNVVRPPA